MSTPKMYSSFIPNGRAEHHLHSPVHQGLPLGDPELSLSQVGSESVQSVCHCERWRMERTAGTHLGRVIDHVYTPQPFNANIKDVTCVLF